MATRCRNWQVLIVRSWSAYISCFSSLPFCSMNEIEDEWLLVLRNNKTRWELFLIWIASVFPQILLKAVSAPAAEPVSTTAESIRQCCWQSYLDLIYDIFRLCFWYVLLRAFECCLQRPTVIVSSRDNLWGNGCLRLCPTAIVNFACCPFCSTVSGVFLFVNRKVHEPSMAKPWSREPMGNQLSFQFIYSNPWPDDTKYVSMKTSLTVNC